MLPTFIYLVLINRIEISVKIGFFGKILASFGEAFKMFEIYNYLPTDFIYSYDFI